MLRTLILTVVLLSVAGPAPAQISIRSGLSTDLEVEPGERYEGTILIRNETAEPQQAKIYQTDYRFDYQGQNEYGAPGSAARSNAAWITFRPAVVTLPPGEMLPVQFVVNVPETASTGTPLEGTYWSMLMVEGIPRGSPESTLAEEEPEYGVRHVMRYGVQVATHVRGQGAGEIAFLHSDLVRDEQGLTYLRFDVENRGSRMLRPDVWVELYDEAGNEMGRRNGVQNRIYPGTSVRQHIDLSDLPAGIYQALIVIDGGGDDLFGARYTLNL